MKYLITLCLLVLSLFSLNDRAQSPGNKTKSVVGILYSSGGGNHEGEYCLNVDSKILCLLWESDKSKFVGMGSNGAGWNTGAVWQVLYRESYNLGDQWYPLILRASFTGTIIPSIAAARAFSEKYTTSVSNEEFRKAYTTLTSSAQQRFTFDRFLDLNKNYNYYPGSICSHSDDVVVLGGNYLTDWAGNNELRRLRLRIVRIDGGWFIDEIIPLDPGEAGCSGVKLQPATLPTTPVTTTTAFGYIDVIEITSSGCRIRFISGDKSYTGIISFDRLSVLTGRRIRSYEDALAFFEGKQINVTLSGITASGDSFSTGSFGGITKITVLPPKGPIPTKPQWKETTTATETIIDLSTDILFDFNKSTINPKAVPSLIKLARLLRQSKSNNVQLNGFTDSIGGDEYNVALSQRRSDAVKQWLVTKGGIDANRLTTNGYGKAQPVAPNTNPDGSDNPTGRQKNRRVEIRIPRN